jgi:hypothetical protein
MTTYWLTGEKVLPRSISTLPSSGEKSDEETEEGDADDGDDHLNNESSPLNAPTSPASNRLEMMAANHEEILKRNEALAAKIDIPNSILVDPMSRPMLQGSNNVPNSKHVNSLSFVQPGSYA